MEAVPKLPLISVELKISSENTHFGPKLKQYIAEAYREDPDSYGNEMHQLEGLRSTAVRPSIDSSGLSVMTRYFCQLRSIQSRFPMAKGQPAACNFAWKDLYANMTCAIPDIRFEMACILYNIGALHTQLGASEPRTSADSMKAACTHFQHAAWAFSFLREQYTQPTGVDVSVEVMRLLQEICFAQAQECILEKSIQDTRKPSVIGAVATQVFNFYKNSLALLGPSTGTDNVHELIGTKLYNYWHRYLSFKSFYIGCIVCLYQGMHAEEQQKMGERVAFYQLAVDKLAEARKLAKYIEPVQITQEALTFTNDVVEGKRKAAKNENEFIYHEEVPDKDLLTDLKPVCLVKALPINFNDPEVSGPDIFARLVPMGAHEAASVYSEEKAKLLRHVVGQAEAKTTEFTEFMSSLQLDQLEVIDSEQRIPQEIVDRCAAMNAKTEVIQTLVDSMNNLAEIISDVEHSLADIKTLIQEETQKEKEYQKIMGPRPPSIVQTELSREFHKYQEAHTRTNESNQVLHKAMTLHIANLRLLAQPLEVLQSKIPSINNIEGLDRATMMEMRRVVAKAREMQTQRDMLIQQFREAINNDDVTSQLLARSNESKEEIFKQELEKHTPKVKIIETNLAAQENIINKLTSLYASYGDSRRLLADVLRKREGLTNALITSYDTYEELLGKCNKGLEFYKKLSVNVNQLLTRLRGTCQVQEEERAQLLAKQTKKVEAPSPTPVMAGKMADIVPPPPSSGGSLKLKDYLPYMKNRGMRSSTPQAQVEQIPPETYYNDPMYPPSVRPTPVGSEADPQMKLPDGVVMPNTYRYPQYPETDSYPMTSTYYQPKPYDKPETSYAYSTPYTPPQYSNQPVEPQYTNPYYTGNQNNTTAVTDSQNVSYVAGNQNYTYEPYSMGQNIPETSFAPTGQPDLTSNFGQMQITPKSEPGVSYATDYSSYYGQGPQTSTQMGYSIPQSSANATSQIASDYSSNASYPIEMGVPNVGATAYSMAQPTGYQTDQIPSHSGQNAYSSPEHFAYSAAYDSASQGYTIYTNTDSPITSTTSVMNVPQVTAASVPQPYSFEPDPNYSRAALAQLDAMDQPIKSHVTGEALSYTNYDQSALTYPKPDQTGFNQTNQSFPTTQYQQNPGQSYQTNYAFVDQNASNFTQSYQNHPGYVYNATSGNYEYNYGGQNTYGTDPNSSSLQSGQEQNWAPNGVYTSAGHCDTVQSPSENIPQTPTDQTNNQIYYNSPYGYQTNTNQSSEMPTSTAPMQTNYGANVNQSTYMQSAQIDNTNVTFSNNQVSTSTPKETVENEQNNEQSNNDVTTSVSNQVENKPEIEQPKPVETASEPSAFDLLSDIDFTVEQPPLMPEIKVPQISESAMKKSIILPKEIPEIKPKKDEIKEIVIERPAKRDLFSDPGLLNRFTQEVKNLQRTVDSLVNKTVGGVTVLDAKWKTFQDAQTKENMIRSKNIATKHSERSIVTEVVPFDDSRVTLKSDPDAYINASYYKQLSSWCIPLVISNNPLENEYKTFWKATVENKIDCIVCLLSEIEMQGKSYWPTAKGQCLDLDTDLKVTLDDVTCTVHWTERNITIAYGKNLHSVTHFQINVFPAKIACSPLVLLADKILNNTYNNRLSNQLSGALIQCSTGAGRSAVVSLLIMVMCQVRAGQPDLCDMLEAGCINLCKHRTNVLEDTKYVADAYRTALFYVQGVLCSGTTMFNGEAVSMPTGAAVLPPVQAPQKPQKFTKESFEEMKQAPGLKSGDMKDPLNFLDPLWSLKKK